MIIYESKGFQTNSNWPDTDWTKEIEGATPVLYIVPDDSEIARNIQAWYPYYDFVTDDEGKLAGVTELERPPEPEPEPTTDELLNILLGVTTDA